jgi:phage terminase large subunit GpA-like protein
MGARSLHREVMGVIASRMAAASPEDLVQWVESHRIIATGASVSGRKRISMTPALRPIYGWIADRNVREIVVQKAAQIGFTDLAVDIILWVAATDPAPMAFFLADEATAKRMMETRIKPALSACGMIRRRGKNEAQDATTCSIRLANGFYLTVGWASSISATASIPYKYVIMDELDKPGYLVARSEGGAVGRIRARVATFPDSKILIGSTPTVEGSLLYREVAAADAIYDWYARCPRCGECQKLRWRPTESGRGGVVWEERASLLETSRTARYSCQHCEALWTTAEKTAAVTAGRLVQRGDAVAAPRVVAYHVSRLDSIFPGGDLDTLCYDWLPAQGDRRELQSFINGTLGEPWLEVGEAVSEADLLSSCMSSGVRLGEMPSAAKVCTMAIDTQADRFFWSIRAWAPDYTSWLVRYGVALSWDELTATIRESGLPIWRVGIDSGGSYIVGGSGTATSEVYDWAARCRKAGIPVFPCKGSSHAMSVPVTIRQLDRSQAARSSAARALSLVIMDTGALKDEFFARAIDMGQRAAPGASYLTDGVGRDYVDQLLSETKTRDRRGIYRWTLLRGAKNHYLDCEVIHLAMANRLLYGGLEQAYRALAAAIRPTDSQPAATSQQTSYQRRRAWPT